MAKDTYPLIIRVVRYKLRTEQGPIDDNDSFTPLNYRLSIVVESALFPYPQLTE